MELDGLSTGATCDDLATRWLAAERRTFEEPASEALANEAERLGLAYEAAVQAASQEELRLAWEAAMQVQGRQEMGSVEWTEARRVAELLRTEYRAAVDRA